MPSFPDIPVVTVAPAPMNIQEALFRPGTAPRSVKPNSIRPDFSSYREGRVMVRSTILGGFVFLIILVAATIGTSTSAHAAGIGQPYDWGRFYYYPYVYYPHNYTPPVQYDNLYYRYPQERQIPVYNTHWHNFYPSPHPYYKGHH